MNRAATLERTQPETNRFEVFAKCPLCGAAEHRPLFTHDECGDLVRCIECRLTYISHRGTPSMPEMRQQHPEPLPDMILQKQNSQVDDSREIIKRIKVYQPNGKLLELGCITGHFLQLARESGYDVAGIEPDPWAAAYARREFGLDVTETLIPEFHIEDKSFDVIVMIHVMEHFTRPMETLLDLRRVLKDTGVLAIEVPIIDTLYPMTMGRHHRHYVFDHTLFLSRKNADEFVRKAGFEILHTELSGRRIRLDRIAWVLGKRTEIVGRLLDRIFRGLGIQNYTVHVNARDNYRIYCRKAV